MSKSSPWSQGRKDTIRKERTYDGTLHAEQETARIHIIHSERAAPPKKQKKGRNKNNRRQIKLLLSNWAWLSPGRMHNEERVKKGRGFNQRKKTKTKQNEKERKYVRLYEVDDTVVLIVVASDYL